MKKIAKWQPLAALEQNGNKMEDTLERLRKGTSENLDKVETWLPAGEIYYLADEVTIEIDLPGVAMVDIDLAVEGNLLLVQGQRSNRYLPDGREVGRCERSYGPFSRTFMLPEGIATEKMRAELESGVLRLSLPRT